MAVKMFDVNVMKMCDFISSRLVSTEFEEAERIWMQWFVPLCS